MRLVSISLNFLLVNCQDWYTFVWGLSL